MNGGPVTAAKAATDRHTTQEEIYHVLPGTLQFKLEDQIIDVPSDTAIPRRTTVA